MKLIFKLNKTILEVFGVTHRICIFVSVNHKIFVFVGVNHCRCKSYASGFSVDAILIINVAHSFPSNMFHQYDSFVQL